MKFHENISKNLRASYSRLLLLLYCCFMSTLNGYGHVGTSVNLTTLILGNLGPLKWLTNTFARNCQLPFLNQRKEKRKYVARPGIEPGTSGSTRPSSSLDLLCYSLDLLKFKQEQITHKVVEPKS